MGLLDTALASWARCEATKPADAPKSEVVCTLSVLSPDPHTKSPEPWPPRPAELASWSVEWRERWGRLANDLQDRGVPWPEHERRAFDQVKAEKDAPEPVDVKVVLPDQFKDNPNMQLLGAMMQRELDLMEPERAAKFVESIPWLGDDHS
jgi:hypothetical protein